VHKAGISVSRKAISERNAGNLENHIVDLNGFNNGHD
jgi:uncharacterized cysteine cluster protein YcgN (CxxCxxCC family)